ncbi:MAG: hypothetical protein GY926_23235 [bacterium]|nr:hypothetical protein [bacterium]
MKSTFEDPLAASSRATDPSDGADFVWQSVFDYWTQTHQLEGFDSLPNSAAGLSQSEFDQLGIYASYGNDLAYQPSAAGRSSTGGWS